MNFRRLDFGLHLAGLGLLLATILAAPQVTLYDEPHRLEVVAALRATGWTWEGLRAMPHATGPLTPALQMALEPLTSLRMPGLRLTNFALLIAVLALTVQTMRRLGVPHPWNASLSMLSLPVTWVVAGLALTEMPAMACVALAVLLLALDKRGWSTILAAGFCLALAALGRQPFALLGAALPLAGWNRRKSWARLAVAALLALSLPLALFSIWGGLVPPLAREVGGGISLRNGTMAFAYAGAFALLYAPGWVQWNRVVLWLGAISLTGNLVLGAVEILPLAGMWRHFLPEHFLPFLARGFGSVFVALALLFAWTLARQAWQRRTYAMELYLAAGTLGLLLATAKITGNFSSRYVAMTFPLLLPLLAPSRHPESPWVSARALAGLALGFVSLRSYLGGW